MKKAAKVDADFLQGILWALQIVYEYSGDVSGDYHEIVQNSGPDDLIKQARKDGVMKESGLSQYIKEKKKYEVKERGQTNN